MRASPAVRSSLDPRRVALLILVIGLVVRSFFCFVLVPWHETSAGVPPAPDCYPDLANTLLHDGQLGFGDAGATPTTVRGPGFPLWLAGGMLTAGYSNGWLAFWGSLPGVFGAAAIAGFLTLRSGAAAGLAGGLIAAAHPLPAFISGRVMSDEFYGVCALAAILLLPLALEETTSALAAGTALGWHLLVRSTGALTLVAILCALPFLIRSRRRSGRPAVRALPFTLFLVLGLAPAILWSARTSRLEGRPVWVNSLLGYNYWVGRSFEETGGVLTRGEAWTRAAGKVREAAGPDAVELPVQGYYGLTPRDAARLDGALTAAAVRDVRDDPGGFAARAARGLGAFWFRAETGSRSLQYLAAALPVLLLALLGAVSLARAAARDAVPPLAGPVLLALIAALVLHVVLGAIVNPMARFSVQLYPALALLAGAGAQGLFDTMVRAPRPPDLPA